MCDERFVAITLVPRSRTYRTRFLFRLRQGGSRRPNEVMLSLRQWSAFAAFALSRSQAARADRESAATFSIDELIVPLSFGPGTCGT